MTTTRSDGRYGHPHYAHRGGAAQVVPLQAGNDTLSGDAGNDYLLGDSLVLCLTYQADHPETSFLQPDPEGLRGYLWQENWELAGHYLLAGHGSQIGDDVLWGGDGDDRVYGQHGNDQAYGEAGDDLVYGGDGETDLVDGGAGTNDVRVRGDDWPNLEKLTELQGRVFQTAAGVWGSELQRAAAAPVPLTVTIGQAAGQADPAATWPIRFIAVFSAPVTDFTADDVQVSGTAPGAVVEQFVAVGSDGTTYEIVVSGMTDRGSVVVTVPAGLAHSADGQANLGRDQPGQSGLVRARPAGSSTSAPRARRVMPGYQRVNQTTRYTAALGFGWTAGKISTADRRTGTRLERDVALTAQGTFVVDVPNGTYRVEALLGDRTRGA